MDELNRRVVMVTGAVGNLGVVVAHRFNGSEASLALVDRGYDRLCETFPSLVDEPDHFLASCTNLLDPQEVGQVVTATLQRLGQIDVLVNTVGGYRAGAPVHEAPFEDWDAMFNLNVRSILIPSRAVIPHMLSRGAGKIVNVSARAGLQGSPEMAAYSAAKSAAIRLTESLSGELRGRGINVNCILPGTIDTPENRKASPDADYSQWVQPESLAEAIFFLASDAARDVHGAALPVYGLS